ncbi:MAG: hypothetical protein GXY83_35300 [Rhodopirellula sp.]|nr:hypothetical protein [Rhodopirellula sp.]
MLARNGSITRRTINVNGGGDLAWMLEQCRGGKSALRTYHDLFREPLQERLEQALEQPRPVPRSRVLDGFGMALLNNPADTIGLMCFYGWRGSHRHLDGLHFDLYAHGKALTPDTGYPDFMNDRVPGIFSWSQATISHNTVTVDARQQTGNPEGQVRRAAFGDCVQYCDLDAHGNYPQTGVYRRALALVATAADQAYLLDVFRVAGGGRHDYSLHGATGECTMLQGDFGEPQKGTLAGEDVAVGELYDEPSMAGKDYGGGYSAYRGSGYQHFVNVRHQTGQGNVVLQFKPDEPPAVQLRMHLLPRELQRVILANARVSPIKRPALLPYAIVRAEGQDLKSVFVSVLEPFTAEPFIRNVEVLFATADAVAVRVERRDSVDLLLQANDDGTMRAVGDAVATDAAFAAVTVGADGRLQRAVAAGGTRLLAAGEELLLHQPARGRIAAVEPAANAVVVAWQGEVPAPAALVGRDLLFRNEWRNSLFRVSAVEPVADGLRLVLRESVLNGRGRVTWVDEAAKAIETDSRMLFQAKYAGMRAVGEDYRGYLPILSAASGRLASRWPPCSPIPTATAAPASGSPSSVPETRWNCRPLPRYGGNELLDLECARPVVAFFLLFLLPLMAVPGREATEKRRNEREKKERKRCRVTRTPKGRLSPAGIPGKSFLTASPARR